MAEEELARLRRIAHSRAGTVDDLRRLAELKAPRMPSPVAAPPARGTPPDRASRLIEHPA